jgi:GTP cyclohydrolase II
VGESLPAVRARVPITIGRGGAVPAEFVTFRGLPDPAEHFACVVRGAKAVPPLVRVHSECLTGDLFGSARCDCGAQFDEALALFARHGGILVYLRQEGRGIGLYNKLDAYLLQNAGADTFEANRLLGRGADERDYGAAALMLQALGVHRIRLLTNNPDKVRQLRRSGIVVTVQPTGVYPTPDNVRYLRAKAEVGGHRLVQGDP